MFFRRNIKGLTTAYNYETDFLSAKLKEGVNMALSSIMTGALLSANTSRQIAHVQHATKKQMDGHAGVLDVEIKLDSARGGDVTK